MMIASSIKTTTRHTQVPAGWVMAKSALGVRTTTYGPRIIYGFALGETEEKATERSRYEVLERAYAYYDVFTHAHGDRDVIPTYDWLSHLQVGQRAAAEVLLAHPRQAPNVDTNGLALHVTLDKAVSHGMMEIVERHLNARIWYEDAGLCLVSNSSFVHTPYQLDLYTTVDKVPYAMAVIRTKDANVLTCGTAVADAFPEAMHKASQEAFMLLDGMLNNDTGGANSSISRTKLLSMKEPAVIQPMLAHLTGRITEAPYPSKVTGLKEIMANVPELTQSDAQYCVLRQERNAVAIRAFWSGALNPKFHPRKGTIPDDPFC